MRIQLWILSLAVALAAQSANAALVITEVANTSGAPAGVLEGQDWWELSNNGPASVLLDGYEWEDNNPQGPGVDTGIFPSGVTIAAGESIIIHQGPSTVPAAFRADWGLSSSVQVLYGEQFGGTNNFSGLGSGGDQINLYNNLGQLVDNATFPSATAGVSFEWSRLNASLGLSVAGENGAYTASNNRIGSPGAVPEPGTLALGGLAIGGLVGCTRRRRS